MNACQRAKRFSVASDISHGLRAIAETSNVYSIYASTWRDKAVECLSAMVHAFGFLREHEDRCLTREFIGDVFIQLPVLEAFINDEAETWELHRRPAGHFQAAYAEQWFEVVEPLRRFVETLPAYARERRGHQCSKVSDHYMFVVRQMACICCSQAADMDVAEGVPQPLPEAETVNRILMLERTQHYDHPCYRREAIRR